MKREVNKLEVEKLEVENERLRRLVAFYQGEGEDEIPEETEYKNLVKIHIQKRTKKQRERLYKLSNTILDKLDPKKLRKRIEELEKEGAE